MNNEKGCGCGGCGAGASAAAAAMAADGAGVTSSFVLDGLDCGDCAAKLEKRVAALAGVLAVSVNFATSKMTVRHTVTDDIIVEAVEKAGYAAQRESAVRRRPAGRPGWRSFRRTQVTFAAGVLLAATAVLEWAGANQAVVIALYAIAAVLGGYYTAKSGLYGLKSFTFDMNFLMAVAVAGAFAIGEWSEGATVAFLFAFGNLLQTYTIDKTRRSIQALMDLAPPEALVRRGGQDMKLPVENIVVGDTVIVKPGERIAMDGAVESGASAVNQAAITGESLPQDKRPGDAVYAGTVNGHGLLELRVTRIAADSTLARIMHLVEEAQAQKAPSQQFVDVFAKYYTPAVLLAAAGVMLIPWLLLDEPFIPWFYKGLVLLVISCPCALVISTPVSIVAAIGNASRRGALIKGGAYLEQMGSIRAIAFDKTGTLTYGKPQVTDIAGLDADERELLIVAASVEKWSEHPLARAIVAKADGLPLKSAGKFTALVGKGAEAEIDGETVYVGNARLFEELGHPAQRFAALVDRLEEAGKTVMLVGTKGRLYGLVAVADTLREDSAAAVATLRRWGMEHVAMLTGDNSRVAGTTAAKLGMDEFYSDLLPEEKVAAVERLKKQYGSVVMVGDGVNDAPALAAADVGVAMGVAGSDAALETADIALMADDLGKLAYVIQLGRKTVAVIKQNIIFAIIVKAVFVALTFAGMANLWLAVFADTGASILVTLNGMRLMRKLD
jgi:Cd2+/Zn2+-exporting ATPase